MQSASPSQWNHTSEGLVPDGWGRNGTCGVAGAVLAGSSGFHWSVHALGAITLVIAKQVLIIGSILLDPCLGNSRRQDGHCLPLQALSLASAARLCQLLSTLEPFRDARLLVLHPHLGAEGSTFGRIPAAGFCLVDHQICGIEAIWPRRLACPVIVRSGAAKYQVSSDNTPGRMYLGSDAGGLTLRILG